MLTNITTRAKLIIPMIVLTIILFFLGMAIIYFSYIQMHSLEKLNKKVILSSYIASTVHSLQKERGLSSGLVEKERKKFKYDLIAQREISDYQLNRLSKQEGLAKSILKWIKRLKEIRKKIDSNLVSSKEVIRFYSKLNAFLLNNVVKISKISHIPVITQNIIAYIDFLYLKEYGGIERAEGVVILSQKSLTREALISFTNLISIQNQNRKMFLKYANDEIRSFYNKTIKDNSFKQVANIENIIIYKNVKTADIDPKYWYEIITEKLNLLDKVGNFIERNTTYLIKKELLKVKCIFYGVLFLTILSFFVFILMIAAFYKLAKEEQKLRLVTQKYIISSITDTKGRIIDVSDAFCKISGYSRKELIGQPHNIVRHPDMPKAVFKELWETIQAGKSWRGKVKNLRKDGGFYWVWANIEPLYDDHGNIDSYIAIRIDITENELLAQKVKEEERKSMQAREMMQQQSRLAQMGEMLSMIAHQWRQPLSAITAASGAIIIKARLKKLDNDTALELSNKIQNFSQHLSKTIDDFRDFFKTNKKKTKTNFKKIVNDVLDIIQNSLTNKNIKLSVNVASSNDFIAYENELKQVLLNLIKNAEDALIDKKIDKPKIVINIYDNKLTIKDNAGGIRDEIIDKIFDPYFSTKTKKDGTGLGLYMSKTIVEEHCKGTLSVRNVTFKDKNGKIFKGAEFEINLGDIHD